MDMNEILQKWDKMNALQLEKNSKKGPNPMDVWMEKYGVIDKDEIAARYKDNEVYADKNQLIKMKPEETLDLHGLHQDEAYRRLDYFIGECVKKGIKKVIIIHGKGIHTSGKEPVLGELVRKFIENDKRCGMSGHPKSQADGGSGVTWIILKNN